MRVAGGDVNTALGVTPAPQGYKSGLQGTAVCFVNTPGRQNMMGLLFTSIPGLSIPQCFCSRLSAEMQKRGRVCRTEHMPLSRGLGGPAVSNR